jgi:surface protein
MRFKFGDPSYVPTSGSDTSTSRYGTWTAVDAARGIWDWTYENSSWHCEVYPSEGTYAIRGMFCNPPSTFDYEVIDSNTAGVTDMSNLFMACDRLTKVHRFDTSTVTLMYGMFASCVKLTEAPLLDTSNCTNMYDMFLYCHSLTSIPAYDTSKVAIMSNMFDGCTSLTSVPLLNMTSAIDISGMFHGCTSLKSVPKFDTHNVQYFGNGGVALSQFGLFAGCSSLEVAPDLDFSSAVYVGGIFAGCSRLVEFGKNNMISLPSSIEVEGFRGMFNGCTLLERVVLNVARNGSRTYWANSLFQDCERLKTYTLPDVPFHSISRMFSGCLSLTKMPVFDVASVQNCERAFLGCRNMESGIYSMYTALSANEWQYSSSYSECFKNCGIDTVSGAAELAQIPASWK